MAKDKDYRGNGKEHRVYLKSLTLVYWGKGVATGYNDAEKVGVLGPMGCEIELAIPAQESLLRQMIILSEESYAAGKKQAKLELRRWLEG